MRPFSLAVVFISLLLSPSFLAVALADDWPTYRHDNRRSGHTAVSLDAPRLHEVWKHVSPHAPRPAWEAPARWDAFSAIRGLRSMRQYDPVFHTVAAQGAVFFGSSVDDSVHCLDAAKGAARWVFTTDGPIRVAPTFVDGKLYFGSDDGHAYCIDAATGKLLWRVRAADSAKSVLHNQRMISLHPVRTGVLIEDGIAYFAGSLLPWEPSYLCAVRASDGSLEGKGCFRRALTDKNTFEAPMLSAAAALPPAPSGGTATAAPLLIAPQGRIAPLLFERDDGQPHGALEGGGGSFVAVAPDGRIIYGPGNKTGWLSENDPTSRKRVANHDRALNAVVTADAAYLLTDTSLAALSRKDRKTLWEVACDCPFDVVLAGSHIFVGGTDRVAAFDAATGRRVWQAKVQGRAYGLTVASGTLLASTDEGVIHAFRPGNAVAPELVDSHRLNELLPPPSEIDAIDDKALLGRWVFQSNQIEANRVRDQVTGQTAAITAPPQLEAWGPLQALTFDGFAGEVLVADDFSQAKTPKESFTAEAWVRVDQSSDWGGFVGIVQDNGDDERGWILGFNKQNFTFAVASEAVKKLTYLPTKAKYEEGQWYYVAGTYDGKAMKVYINGRLDSESAAQRGPILYPPKALYTIGSYHDKDEFYKLRGAIQEVRVWDRALSADEIAKHYTVKRRRMPEPPPTAQLSFGPLLEFTAPDRATVRWETPAPCPSKLVLRTAQDSRTIEKKEKATKHELAIDGLRRDRVYFYEIITEADGKPAQSQTYECDTHFNYTQAKLAEAHDIYSEDAVLSHEQERMGFASHVLATSKVDRGMAVVFGAGDGGWLAFRLARTSDLHVLCVDTDETKVAKARESLLKAKAYGSRVTVLKVDSYKKWPLRGDFANLVLANEDVPAETIDQVLRPDGGIAFIDVVMGKPRKPLPGAGVWSHQYGRADNTAFGGEQLGGARATGELETQWLGKPGPRAQVDRQPRKPSPLAVKGRLFVQGFPRLTALDAYNGSVLWSLEAPPVVRFNVPRDCSNWCADDEHVFVAVQDRVWRIDAGSGKLLSTWPVLLEGAAFREADFGCVMRVGDSLIGSAVPRDVSHRRYWTSDSWYDSIGGDHAAKVCSDNLFALHPRTGAKQWLYQNGLIINATIAADDKHIYFVESRDPAIRSQASRRLDGDAFWAGAHLVCLDAASGSRVWDRPLKSVPGSTSIQLAVAGEMIVIGCSHQKQYHTYAISARDGSEIWKAADNWFDGKDQGAAHHGTHLSRPVIVAGRVIIRPWVYDLATGRKLEERMPVIREGHGCGSYVACQNALVFRSGDMAMWDFAKAGKTTWPRLRPDCWISTIPALGMILSPEAGGGCSCGSWMETSIGLMPVKRP